MGGGSERRDAAELTPAADGDLQVAYAPRSQSFAVGTLVPRNMRDAVAASFDRLEGQVVNLDEFVADRLGYSAQELAAGFSAEQVDALAMAIHNAKQGGGFIIGDQTGIGMGHAIGYLQDNSAVYHQLGGSDLFFLADPAEADEGYMCRLTGYLPLLPIATQARVYDDLIQRYRELIQRETELGTNKLEARALDLDAETLAAEVADPGKVDKASLFAAPVVMERVSIKRTSKPLTRDQVRARIAERLDGQSAWAVANDMRQALRNQAEAYIAQAEADAAAGDIGAASAALDAMRGRLAIAEAQIKEYQIGSAHRFDLDGQIFYGIVLDVKQHQRAANPAAGSSWLVQFALAMADANQVTIPFSQLGTKYKTEAIQGTMWGDLASGGNRFVQADELFDLAQTAAREKRWMVTGNLLSGYAKFPGQLVHYTKNDGAVSQDILMGRAYDFAKTKEMLGARLASVERVMVYFARATNKAVIVDQDQALRIEQERPGIFTFQVPSSKKKGGLYSLDRALTDILGGDFVSSGAVMRVRVQGAAVVERALAHVLGEQADYFTALTEKAIAGQVNDTANSGVAKGLGGDGGAPAVMARRASSGVNMEQFPGAVDTPDAVATVSRIVAELGFSAKSAVVEGFDDLPQSVQDDARNQGADEDGVKGLYHDGVLYVVHRNVSSIADIEETVFHEALGHYGLRKLLGPAFIQKTNALFASLGGIEGLSAIARRRGFDKTYDKYVRGVAAARGKDPAKWTDATAKLVLTEEVFAHIAEVRPDLADRFKALIGKLREWLRKHTFLKLASYGETDLLHLFNRVRADLPTPGGGPKGGVSVPGVLSHGDAPGKADIDFAADVLAELSFEDGLFRYAISPAKTIEGNLRDAGLESELHGVEHDGQTLGDSPYDRRLNDFTKPLHRPVESKGGLRLLASIPPCTFPTGQKIEGSSA
ncbi:MAG: hypothetical protein HYU74_03145 [Dechloromonas sp.]|nr:hypothetical protein [Dechloromonas sp.]